MHEGTAVVRVNNIEVGSMPLPKYQDIASSVNKNLGLRTFRSKHVQ